MGLLEAKTKSLVAQVHSKLDAIGCKDRSRAQFAHTGDEQSIDPVSMEVNWNYMHSKLNAALCTTA